MSGPTIDELIEDLMKHDQDAAAALAALHAENERLKAALEPLAANGNFYRPEVPHFEMVRVPLEYLRAAAIVFKQVTGRTPVTPTAATPGEPR